MMNPYRMQGRLEACLEPRVARLFYLTGGLERVTDRDQVLNFPDFMYSTFTGIRRVLGYNSDCDFRPARQCGSPSSRRVKMN